MSNNKKRRPTYTQHRVEGSVVRKSVDAQKLKEVRRSRHSMHAQKNREKAQHMNLKYVSFLLTVLVVLAMVMVEYIELRADITHNTSEIANLETILNDKSRANEDEYNLLESSIDWDRIKRVAIYELGMVYASEDQVVTYEINKSDYVRQYFDIPK